VISDLTNDRSSLVEAVSCIMSSVRESLEFLEDDTAEDDRVLAGRE